MSKPADPLDMALSLLDALQFEHSAKCEQGEDCPTVMSVREFMVGQGWEPERHYEETHPNE